MQRFQRLCIRETYDAYAFAPQIPEYDLHLFNEGKLRQAYRTLGSHSVEIDGVAGVLFSVWAPNAGRVSVVGEFNRWDGRVHQMAVEGLSGVWKLFIPGLASNSLYKYEIRNRDSGEILLKTDPYAMQYELRPHTAALTPHGSEAIWQDSEWIAQQGDMGLVARPAQHLRNPRRARGNGILTAVFILIGNSPFI